MKIIIKIYLLHTLHNLLAKTKMMVTHYQMEVKKNCKRSQCRVQSRPQLPSNFFQNTMVIWKNDRSLQIHLMFSRLVWKINQDVFHYISIITLLFGFSLVASQVKTLPKNSAIDELVRITLHYSQCEQSS